MTSWRLSSSWQRLQSKKRRRRKGKSARRSTNTTRTRRAPPASLGPQHRAGFEMVPEASTGSQQGHKLCQVKARDNGPILFTSQGARSTDPDQLLGEARQVPPGQYNDMCRVEIYGAVFRAKTSLFSLFQWCTDISMQSESHCAQSHLCVGSLLCGPMAFSASVSPAVSPRFLAHFPGALPPTVPHKGTGHKILLPDQR